MLIETGDQYVVVVRTDKGKDLFARLRERADVILVDAPPVLGMADVALLTPLVDEKPDARRAGGTEHPADAGHHLHSNQPGEQDARIAHGQGQNRGIRAGETHQGFDKDDPYDPQSA